MSNLSEYIKQTEKYKEENPEISEEELIRHVYMDLGMRFSFNPNYLPFGNSKTRKEIYNRSRSEEDLNECMENNIIICKSVAYILEKVLKSLGVDIETVIDEGRKNLPHIYNIIHPKDGGESYSIDLQEDMYRIQAHYFSKNFGLSLEDKETFVISRDAQEQMDRKSRIYR